MYRTQLQTRDKGGAIIAVAAVHAGLFLALLQISGRVDLTDPQNVMSVFDVTEAPPPPPPPPPPPEQIPAKAKESSGGAPANIKSEATPIKRVAPRVRVPAPTPVRTSETPAQGASQTQGSSSLAGSGTGAGGSGTGTGAGAGSGSAASGDGGVVQPPRLLTPVLTGRDFPPEMLAAWPGRTPVFLKLRIDANGSVAQCVVDRGTGNPLIDRDVCRTAQARLRYRPALNREGRPVAGWTGYAQRPLG